MSYGGYRLRVYDFVEKLLQREMNEQEHAELRGVLVEFIQHQRRVMPNVSTNLFVCEQCHDVKIVYGKQFRNALKLWNKQNKHLKRKP